MLVLSRKVGERILVGERIAITVVRLSPGSVRIGVDAPADLAIVREELSAARSDENRAECHAPTACALGFVR